MLTLSFRNLVKAIAPQPVVDVWGRLGSSPLAARLAHGALWSILGAVISRVFLLGANVMVARILAREVYGELGIIRSTVSMFFVFAGFSMGVTATKHVAEFRHSDPQRAGRIIVLSGLFTGLTSLFIGLGLLVFAPFIALHSLNAAHLAPELKVGALTLVLSAINGAQLGALAGFEAFKAIAWINLLAGLCSPPILVAGALYGGLRGSVWALAANAGINWVLSHIALRRAANAACVPLAYGGCMREWPIIWKFSLPVVLSAMMVSPVLWLCNAILVSQPGGYAQMGLFDAANQWRAAILFIPGMVGQIALPLLSSLNGLSQRSTYNRILKLNLFLNCGSALAICIPIIAAAPAIMRTYGTDFSAGAPVLVCLACTSILVSANGVVGQALVSKGRVWAGLLFNSLWAGSLIVLCFLLARGTKAALGLAFANLIAYVLHTLWQSAYLIRLLRSSPPKAITADALQPQSSAPSHCA